MVRMISGAIAAVDAVYISELLNSIIFNIDNNNTSVLSSKDKTISDSDIDSIDIVDCFLFVINIQLFRIARLGEQDLHEQKVQLFCFITRLSPLKTIHSMSMNTDADATNDDDDHHNIPQQQQRRPNGAGEDDDIDGGGGGYNHVDDDDDGGGGGDHQHHHNVDSSIDDDNDGNDDDDYDDDGHMDAGFVSPQLMSRLSQKNPSAIRYADEDRGQQSYHMDLEIIIDNDRNNNNNNDGGGGDIFRQRSPSSITIISPHIRDNCVANNDNNEDNDWSQYNHRIYASYDDLRHWTDGHRTFANISNAIKKLNYSNTDNDGIQQNRNLQQANTNGQKSRSQLSSKQTNSTDDEHEQQLEKKFRLVVNQERMRCGQIISNWMLNGDQTESSLNQSSSNKHGLLSSIMMMKSMFNNHRHRQQPCHCSLNIFIPWYVCGVRYCPIQQPEQSDPQQQQQQSQNMQRYRCGVRTCRKRYQFSFAVPNHIHCLSDFDPTTSTDTMDAFDTIINGGNEMKTIDSDRSSSLFVKNEQNRLI
ncbi:hypothetical protein HUG17_3357 [Dermatophagoides farinae]|uniref:Uncharacterized protein n=1 Tax=Dermatophagoides farinae TaxID=6954 RepID=A0A9D4SEK8_DERFA|nr:hypothetical protein HUG17_3357 [Dermatophagoides farinae]